MPESTQHKLDRVRPPRVQITYDVETGGAIVMKELPFVVGIMADLSGVDAALESKDRHDPASLNGKMRPPKAEAKRAPLKERKYLEIDRDNFKAVMESIAPRLKFSVNRIESREYTEEEYAEYRKKHHLGEHDKLPRKMYKPDEGAGTEVVELEFLSLDDFNPINIVKQVGFLRQLLETRKRLSDLLMKLDGNDKLWAELQDIIEKPVRLTNLKNEQTANAAVTTAARAVATADAAVAAATEADTAAKAKQTAAPQDPKVLAVAQAAAAAKTAAEAAKTAAGAAKTAADAAKAADPPADKQAVDAARQAADDALAAADAAKKQAEDAKAAVAAISKGGNQ